MPTVAKLIILNFNYDRALADSLELMKAAHAVDARASIVIPSLFFWATILLPF